MRGWEDVVERLKNKRSVRVQSWGWQLLLLSASVGRGASAGTWESGSSSQRQLPRVWSTEACAKSPANRSVQPQLVLAYVIAPAGGQPHPGMCLGRLRLRIWSSSSEPSSVSRVTDGNTSPPFLQNTQPPLHHGIR